MRPHQTVSRTSGLAHASTLPCREPAMQQLYTYCRRALPLISGLSGGVEGFVEFAAAQRPVATVLLGATGEPGRARDCMSRSANPEVSP